MMGVVILTLGPLALLIAFGAVLTRIRFLGPGFITDLNKLAFWIALPALLFVSSASGGETGSQTWQLLGILIGSSFLIAFIAWICGRVLRLPPGGNGTLMQAAFRGNLAYIGIPVLAADPHAGQSLLATAAFVMVMTMAFYNVFAVVVLQSAASASRDWPRVIRSILTNPLLIAGLLGILVPLVNVPIPAVVDKTLRLLGAAAVPISLLCIGGSLASLSIHGRLLPIVVAALLKIAVLPVLVFGLCQLIGLGAAEQKIALVLSACPTAAASFVMAKQMGGDEALASGSIALSTVLSAISLAVVLWIA